MNYLSKENVLEIVELSMKQKELVSSEQPDEAGTPLDQLALPLLGPVDADLIEDAWNHVIRNHAQLRTVFRTLRNQLVQVYLRERPVQLQAHAAEEASFEQICREHRSPLNIGEGPMHRIGLVRTANQESWLLLSWHPLIADLHSAETLLEEWNSAYQALLQGNVMSAHERGVYKEYINWVGDQDWSPAQAFLAAQQEDLTAPTSLLEVERPVRTSDHISSAHLDLTPELSRALEAKAVEAGVNSEAILHTAWAMLIHVYSGEADVHYGATVSGRPSALQGAQNMIGPLENTLPARYSIDGTQLLHPFLQNTQAQLAEIHRFSFLPAKTDANLFTSRLSVREQSSLSGFKSNLTGHHPLAIDARLGSSWHLEFTFAENRIAKASVERMQLHLLTLLTSIAQAGDTPIGQLPVLPQDEAQKLFVDFQQSAQPNPSLDLLAHLVIERQMAETPDKLATVCGDDSITYGELNQRANSLAHWLRAQGFGRDDVAALLAERSIDMQIAILAVLKAGGAYVPLDSAHPDNRLCTVLENSGATFVLTQHQLASRTLELSKTVPNSPLVFCLDQAPEGVAVHDVNALANFSTDNPVFLNEEGDLANIFFTSGSTGLPKGAMVEQIGMLNHLWAKINLCGLTKDSIVAQNASHCFDISVWQFLAPLMVGGQVVIYPNAIATDPDALFASIKRDGVTTLELVPAMIDLILQATEEQAVEARQLPALLNMVSTGEGLPVELCDKWLLAYPHIAVINAYGATETSDDITHAVITAPGQEEQTYASLGHPIPHLKIYLLDKWMRPVPIGCAGEVCCTGIGVGRGYINDPERTAKAFVQNPFDDGMGPRMYKTGDIGYFLPDGRLVYVGRADNQVKVRGHRIELGEVESALRSYPAVRQSAAIVRKDSFGQNRILAYIVPEQQAEPIDQNALRDHLRGSLPEYMIPEQITQLDSLPLNRNGKVDRKALPDPDETSESSTPYVAPRNELESQLAKIWEDVLEVKQVGLDDNFFTLGGHSLKTIKVRSRIKYFFGADIPLVDLFDKQTLRELAPLVEANSGGMQDKQDLIEHLATAEQYPMSHAQRRLFFLQQFDPTNTSYNMPLAVELSGTISQTVLERTIQTILDRHEGLRTTFGVVDGQPVQRVTEQFRFNLPYDDFSSLDEEARVRALEAATDLEFNWRFDLEKGPVFRVRLAKLEPERHVLWMNMHHIVSDMWSWQVLFQELGTLYAAYSQDQEPSLAPLMIQYRDFAVWQNGRIERGDLAADEQFWSQHLQGELPVLNLPTDHPRKALQQFAGSKQNRQLNDEMVERLKQLSQERDATLFMVLLSATGVFLSRLSGQEDLIVGTPEAGRNRVELEALIGFFINTLPMRLDLSGNPTVLDLLERVKSTSVEAYEHNEYPFDQLVDLVNPVRDLSRPPIFSVMFQVNRFTAEEPIGNLTLRNLSPQDETSKFDLTITFTERAESLEYEFSYRTDLFENATIERWMESFELLLQGFVQAPNSAIGELPMLSDREKETLLVHINETAKAYDIEATIHSLFEKQALQTPDSIAIVAEGQTLTYQELHERSERLATYLQQQGVGPGSVVGLSVERSLWLPIGLLAILKAGGAYVPLDPMFPADRIAYMIEDSNMSLLLTQSSLVTQLPVAGQNCLVLDKNWDEIAQSPILGEKRAVSSSDLAYILYTSGSTGRPKGVQIEHRSVVNFLTSMADEPGLTQDDVMLSVTTFSFDIFGLELYLPLMKGARTVLVSRETAADGMRLAEALEQSNATIMQATPATWKMLLQVGWKGHPETFKILCGGEAFPPELVRELLPRASSVWNMYGPTETTIWSTLHQVTEETGSVPIGRPIGNTEVYLLDANLQPVPTGASGQLFIGGHGLARGYLNRPDLTEQVFLPHPFTAAPNARLYATGDLARFLPDGTLECLGRSDHQVKIRGYRIELHEIETVLLEHPQIREAVVIVREDTPGDQRLTAYLVLENEDVIPSFAELRTFVTAKLPDYMVPTAWKVQDKLPLTPNGKIDRKALPAVDSLLTGENDTYASPRTALEIQMVKLWEEVLNIQPIGIEDNFFAIGGHSLKALVLINAIKQRFGADLPLAVLFRSPTVAELCTHIDSGTIETEGCLIPIRTGSGERPPLFLIHAQGGGVLAYFHLARALGGEETVYGVQALGYESQEQPLESIEDMATYYSEQILALQPTGPYRIAGWSFGGLVAYEMVRYLEKNGHAVDFLGLLDTHTYDLLEEMHEWSMQDVFEHYGTLFGVDLSLFAGLSDDEGLLLLLNRAKELGEVPPEATYEHMKQKMRVLIANGTAMARYLYTGPIQSDIRLFNVEEVSILGHEHVNVEAWSERTTGQIDVIQVSGTHTNMCQPPHVSGLADAMGEYLNATKTRRSL